LGSVSLLFREEAIGKAAIREQGDRVRLAEVQHQELKDFEKNGCTFELFFAYPFPK
jgi:hypothetical protein